MRFLIRSHTVPHTYEVAGLAYEVADLGERVGGEGASMPCRFIYVVYKSYIDVISSPASHSHTLPRSPPRVRHECSGFFIGFAVNYILCMKTIQKWVPSADRRCQALSSADRRCQALSSADKRWQTLPSAVKRWQALTDAVKRCQALSSAVKR